ncbi:MAG: glycosyltransferase family 4 protein [Actinomycetota bacterium]|nr:glycosyltransferase family 4 protein [Actinomycetota bacterium]
MRILYSVQRYGAEIVGGSESACRNFAENLVSRGHEVEVTTSCARSYVDWADAYQPGTSTINGVTVHRHSVRDVRRPEIFGPLDKWVHEGPHPVPLSIQQQWSRAMGPDLAEQRSWLIRNSERFDVAIFMTYLYSTTTAGLPAVARLLPTVLQPTAHDEPPFRIGIMDPVFRLADAMLFFTPEEQAVVENRFGFEPTGRVVGMGIDLGPIGQPQRFRHRFNLGGCDYLLYAGRVDPMKGAIELANFFIAFKERNPGDLKLVVAGEQVVPLPQHPDIVFSGFLDEESKHDALAGSLALAQPSYFESFSIVLCESWVQSRPALVQANCEVLAGQARRSGGAIPYRGFAQFEAALLRLLRDPAGTAALGRRGREYVERNYEWDTVVAGVESVIEAAQTRFGQRRAMRQ